MSTETEYKPHLIMVITGCAKTHNCEYIRKIDQNNPNHNEWLMKHTWWAMRNDRLVTMIPFEHYDENKEY